MKKFESWLCNSDYSNFWIVGGWFMIIIIMSIFCITPQKQKTIECEYHLIIENDSINIINEAGMNLHIHFDSCGELTKILLKDNE